MLAPRVTGVNRSLSQHRGRWHKAGPERGLSQTSLAWHQAKVPQSWEILAGTTLGSLPSFLCPQGCQTEMLNCKSHVSHAPSQKTDALPTISSEILALWFSRLPTPLPLAFQPNICLTSSLASGTPYPSFTSVHREHPTPSQGQTHDLPATTSTPPATIPSLHSRTFYFSLSGC